ncbi:MAG: prolyl aminopeptidase [Ignavibacteriaceae bacterium]|nr:prolyl aminopeptidase [Ignavibacteriaceae bacterium]
MNEYTLWPEIKSFDEGFLKVSDIHTIRYALYGNPKGKPVFFLHGGPGGGCNDEDARWFDPSKYLIVTHDQRGSGKSTPLAEIRENIPNNLVNDIESLRKHLNIQTPFSIFAGSWGTTLALLYAEAYPKNISRMILRGIFTCSYDEQDYFYSATGAAKFSPEAWENLIKKIPQGTDRIQERIHKLIENSDEEEKLKWCRILAEYEYSFFNLSSDELNKALENMDLVFKEMRINIFYQANRFFLEDNQIIKNIDSIKHLPVSIVHGSGDLICPPASAFNLHKHLSNSTFVLVPEAGHLSSDHKIQQALIEAVNNWR